jgi:hypothetical protein
MLTVLMLNITLIIELISDEDGDNPGDFPMVNTLNHIGEAMTIVGAIIAFVYQFFGDVNNLIRRLHVGRRVPGFPAGLQFPFDRWMAKVGRARGVWWRFVLLNQRQVKQPHSTSSFSTVMRIKTHCIEISGEQSFVQASDHSTRLTFVFHFINNVSSLFVHASVKRYDDVSREQCE